MRELIAQVEALKAVPMPLPDTTQYAQWQGQPIKYHSLDQIIEFANARVAAALRAQAEQHTDLRGRGLDANLTPPDAEPTAASAPPCNLPFERIPQHAGDPGFGPVPTVIPLGSKDPKHPSNQPQAEQPAAQGEPVARVVSFTNGSYWRNYTLEWTGEASVGDKLYLRPDPRIAATEQPAEAVAHIVSSGRAGMPLLQWMSADHSFRAPIGTKLYAHPDPRIAALEGLLREALPYTMQYINNEGYKTTALYERIEAALGKEG